jgi:transcriptional regulator with XRE-family HTH domain
LWYVLSVLDSDKIRKAAKAAEMSLAKLARRCGYSKNWLSQTMCGRKGWTLPKARLVAKHLGVPLDSLRSTAHEQDERLRRALSTVAERFEQAVAAANAELEKELAGTPPETIRELEKQQRRLRRVGREGYSITAPGFSDAEIAAFLAADLGRLIRRTSAPKPRKAASRPGPRSRSTRRRRPSRGKAADDPSPLTPNISQVFA